MACFGPALDRQLGRSGRKTTTLVRDHKYFIPNKFHQNPSSCFDGRRTDGQWTDGRTVRYDNSSLEPSAQVSLKGMYNLHLGLFLGK